MKKKIHPQYGPAVITCACGNTVKTHGTVPKMEVEICSACHPFYTGKSKLVDSTGQVDRFMKRFQKSQTIQAKTKKVSSKGKGRAAKTNQKPAPKTLEEIKKQTPPKNILPGKDRQNKKGKK